MNYAPSVSAIAGKLQGPGPDVRLMVDVLTRSGMERSDMRVLLDAPEHMPQNDLETPTRKHILAALADLSQDADPGDEIIIYLAGHGAQVPVEMSETEPDGLDEIFLPSDFHISQDQTPRNFVRDDEIGHYIDKMIRAGANVWLIADTCHSGSFRRSDGRNAVARFVDLTGSTIQTPSFGTLIDMPAQSVGTPGTFTGFYAARAGALAYETKPRDSDETHGLLTWSLANALRKSSAATYADLARSVTTKLWTTAQGRADPFFDGALGARHMLAQDATQRGVFGVSINDTIEVQAGRLDGAKTGARIALKDISGVTLFETQIVSATLTTAYAALPIEPTPQLDKVILNEGLDPERFRKRWLQDRAPSLNARLISRPINSRPSLSVRLDKVPNALAADVLRVTNAVSNHFTQTTAKADFEIVGDAQTLSLRPAPPHAANALTLPARSSSMDELAILLQRVARAHAVQAVAVGLEDSALSRQVTAKVSVNAGQPDASGTCRSASAFDAQSEPIARATHCDRVTIDVANMSAWPVDVTPLYVAPDHQIYFLGTYAKSDQGGWRIPPNGLDRLQYTEVTELPDGAPLPTGPMQIVLLLQRGRVGETPMDFRYLQDADPPPKTRAGGNTGLHQLLTNAGFGLAKTRSIEESVAIESGA
ncbi:MAG: caspase family protein, partial [Pseudomonadota bacterium]